MEVKKTSKANIIISVVLVVIAVALAALTFFFYRQYQNIKKNPNQIAQAEIDAVTANVGRISTYLRMKHQPLLPCKTKTS